VWPWLVGAGVLGLLALSSGSGATTSSAAAPPFVPSSGVHSVSKPSGPSLSHDNIEAAFNFAMDHETNSAALMEFGIALTTYGYVDDGAALINRSATILVPSIPTPGESSFQQYPYGSPAGTNTIQWWVNHYAKATPPYKNGEYIHPSDISLAVHNALAHATGKDVDDLSEFVTELDAYGYASERDDVAAHVLTLIVSLLKPYVKKYAGTSTVNQTSIQKTIDALTAHGTPADQAEFGTLLEGGWQRGFSDFGTNWLSRGQALVALGKKRGAHA
jgi:hypothetical protein